jgi:hypothetical protein
MAERYFAEAEAHVAKQAHILDGLRRMEADEIIIQTAERRLTDFQTNLTIARVHLGIEQKRHSKAP